MTINLDPNNLPHMIHADTQGAQLRSFPTHTHGLNGITLPEIFINATCFGPMNNARVINFVVATIASDDDLISKIHAKEEIEIELDETMTLVLRPVSNTHMGVLAAYPPEEQRKELDFAQLYVKGDDHVLDETYFAEAYNIALNPELADPCSPDCSCYKHEDGE